MIDRYTRKEIRKIWEEKNKYQIWLDIEVSAAQAMERLKLIINLKNMYILLKMEIH